MRRMRFSVTRKASIFSRDLGSAVSGRSGTAPTRSRLRTMTRESGPAYPEERTAKGESAWKTTRVLSGPGWTEILLMVIRGSSGRGVAVTPAAQIKDAINSRFFVFFMLTSLRIYFFGDIFGFHQGESPFLGLAENDFRVRDGEDETVGEFVSRPPGVGESLGAVDDSGVDVPSLGNPDERDVV